MSYSILVFKSTVKKKVTGTAIHHRAIAKLFGLLTLAGVFKNPGNT
ncbi:MAG: hypothetical protein ACRAVC_15670 [Trichormus sp.]